ncbi:VaFE repeat-containing surface-anchored protein, partial [Bacillus thuringiensis]|uniref:VaFE repeat-containing surface-anchored protein n=1 Tax=Bacillus thuringiensis TaxID=1428 RepID=UPI003D6D4F60
MQHKLQYKHLILPKQYLLKPKLIHNLPNKPLLLHPKELIPQPNFTPKNKHPSIFLQFTSNPSQLSPKQLVLFQELYQHPILVP